MSTRKNKRSKTLPNVGNKYNPTSTPLATSDGQSMSQVLSTFSATEKDRFAAYRRSTFASDAVSKYVVQCLLKHSDEARNQRRRGLDLGGEDLGISRPASDQTYHGLTKNISTSEVKPLSEYVAAGNANRIDLIVGTIAKIYAQRLVKSARGVANEKGYSNERKILPEHVIEAHMNRSKLGFDPGFYMQPTSHDAFVGAAVAPASVLKRKMEEAQAAQDEYDKSQQK